MAKWRCSGKYKNINKALDIIGVLLIISLCIITFIEWRNAPDIIPTHYNFQGEIDAYGSKNMLFFLLPIIVILYIGLYVLAGYPQVYNYVIRITGENKERQYNMSSTLIRVLNIEIVSMVTYIQLKEATSIFSGRGNLSFEFLSIALVGIFGTLALYIYKSVKNK
ncbi:DUF1648 domain-containing protein [Clostridium perfringens]|nr:DUF1648 domain-containing protein [Clostridium perfringens]